MNAFGELFMQMVGLDPSDIDSNGRFDPAKAKMPSEAEFMKMLAETDESDEGGLEQTHSSASTTCQLTELFTALEIEKRDFDSKIEFGVESEHEDEEESFHSCNDDETRERDEKIVSFGDESVLRKLSFKQALKLRTWQVKYRKTLRTFGKIIPRFEKFVKLTSGKDHPFHKEGRYIQKFLDNDLSQWVDDDVKYFEKYRKVLILIFVVRFQVRFDLRKLLSIDFMNFPVFHRRNATFFRKNEIRTPKLHCSILRIRQQS